MTSALDVDVDGDAGDWRMAFVARVAGDAPPYKVNRAGFTGGSIT